MEDAKKTVPPTDAPAVVAAVPVHPAGNVVQRDGRTFVQVLEAEGDVIIAEVELFGRHVKHLAEKWLSRPDHN